MIRGSIRRITNAINGHDAAITIVQSAMARSFMPWRRIVLFAAILSALLHH